MGGLGLYPSLCRWQLLHRHNARKHGERVAEHQDGRFGGFTSRRHPAVFVYSEHFDRIVDAIAAERKIKGWSRAKKEALMTGDFERLSHLAERQGPFRRHGSRRVAARRSSP